MIARIKWILLRKLKIFSTTFATIAGNATVFPANLFWAFACMGSHFSKRIRLNYATTHHHQPSPTIIHHHHHPATPTTIPHHPSPPTTIPHHPPPPTTKIYPPTPITTHQQPKPFL